VVALITEHVTWLPLVKLLPHGVPVPSEMATVAVEGPNTGVSFGAVPAFTVEAFGVRLVALARVAVTVTVLVAVVPPSVTVRRYVVSSLIAAQVACAPLVMLPPHAAAPVPSTMVAVAAAGPNVGVSLGVPPALTFPAEMKLVMLAGVAFTDAWLVSVEVPAVTVST